MDPATEQIQPAQKQGVINQTVSASIIIVHYDKKDELLRCMSSIIRTAHAGRTTPICEILIVDNASSESLSVALNACFPQAIYVRSESNVGFGAGCNIGAQRATGKYLVFLNPDTIVEEGWLDNLIAALEHDLTAGLVTSKILLANDPGRINTCGNVVHLTGITLCRGLGFPRQSLPDPGEVHAVSGAAFAIRREVFELLGGFDEDMFLYMEDTDISMRARLAGWRCLYAPDSVVLHDYALKLTPLKVFWQERNRYIMLLKNLRWPTLFVLLPAYLLAELITWGFVFLKDRANIGNKLSAYWWIVVSWSRVMGKRRATQALRKVRDRHLLRYTSFELDFEQGVSGPLGTIIRLLFTPLFFVMRLATLVTVHW